jgi:colanic acid biosynthesis glycosyl transferase WcaI
VRILIVSQYFHPENFRVNQLAVALKEQGHEIVILTGQPNYPSGGFFPGYGFARPLDEQYQGMRVIRVPLVARGRGRSWQLMLNYLSFAFFATLFGLPRLKGRFDACIAYCPSPITGAIPAIAHRLFRKTPVALWLQDLWPEAFFAVTKSNSRTLRRLLSSLVRAIYKHVDQIWIQSPGYSESVRAHGGRDDQVRYVPNWAEDLYDCDRWSDVVADRIPQNSLVFAGNLGRAQGLEGLVDAAELTARSAPEVNWVFVGDGTLREWLESEIDRRSLASRVTLLPRRAPEDMPKVLKPAAALLISLGNDEVLAQTIPSKVQTSLAAGRPVIGVLAGEPARIIEVAQCGFVCSTSQPSMLAETIDRFFKLPRPERETMGRNGHTFYKDHFTQTRVTAQAKQFLEEMIGRCSK